MKKKVFIIILSVVLFIPTLFILVSSESNVSNLYDENAKVKQTIVDKPFAVQFTANDEFSAIEIFIANTTSSKTTLQISLYKWDTNYQITLLNDPLISQEIETDLKKKDWFTWDLTATGSALPAAGEYVVYFEKTSSGNMLINVTETTYTKARLYESNLTRGGNIEMRLRYTGNGSGLGDISSNNQYIFEDFDRFTAIDGLGRELPGYSEAGPVREGKFVGIFFHTWHDWDASRGSRNVTEILKEHPDIANDWNSPHWGNAPVYHWNEPVYNYYKNTDRWVLRKQAEMLANAGVDVVIFDNSNGPTTYIDVVEVLLEEFAKARLDGVKTPQISFLMNFFSANYGDTVTQLKELYNAIYKPGRYQDLWFYWKGKPLVMAYPDNLKDSNETEKEIKEFFTFRPGQPSYATPQQFVGQWGWLSVYPQQVFTNEDGSPEQITVGVAQNYNAKRGLTAMNGEGVYGRTYSHKLGGYDTRDNAKLYGANFAEQFEYALKVDPEFIFITGWNEWVVSRYKEWCGVINAFPDSYNDEFSRDIEPSLGDLKDHYYYQMIKYIRLFKGVKPPFEVSDKKTIDINSDADEWSDVLPEFYAYPGNIGDRDSKGYLNNETNKFYHYTNNTGRNDFKLAKIARDDNFIYFMVECTNEISPSSDGKWMRLLLDINGSENNNWETFNYIINRKSPTDNKATLEKCTGGWNWEAVGEVDYTVKDNRLQIKVPKSMLGIKNDKMTINFKWSDNMQADGDIMDFYANGDVAPGGRFKYQYTTQDLTKKKTGAFNPIFAVIGGGIAVLAVAVTAGVISKKKKKA